MGGTYFDFSLPSSGSSQAASFWGGFSGAGGVYGTVLGGSILNLTNAGNISDTLRIDFTGNKVIGFGTWVFDDDNSHTASFSLTVEDYSGATWTSSIIDANPGLTNHTVEGFVGVVLHSGIKSITVSQYGSAVTGFELDHIQIAAVPEPTTYLLVLLGLVVLNIRRKRFKT